MQKQRGVDFHCYGSLISTSFQKVFSSAKNVFQLQTNIPETYQRNGNVHKERNVCPFISHLFLGSDQSLLVANFDHRVIPQVITGPLHPVLVTHVIIGGRVRALQHCKKQQEEIHYSNAIFVHFTLKNVSTSQHWLILHLTML